MQTDATTILDKSEATLTTDTFGPEFETILIPYKDAVAGVSVVRSSGRAITRTESPIAVWITHGENVMVTFGMTPPEEAIPKMLGHMAEMFTPGAPQKLVTYKCECPDGRFGYAYAGFENARNARDIMEELKTIPGAEVPKMTFTDLNFPENTTCEAH